MPEPWEVTPEELAAHIGSKKFRERTRRADRIASGLLARQLAAQDDDLDWCSDHDDQDRHGDEPPDEVEDER